MKNGKERRPVAVLLIVLLLLSAVAMTSFAQDALRGDVNGDGRADSRDARLTLRAAARLVTLADEELARADMNADGKVSAADARTILQIAAKIRTEYDFDARYIRSFDVNEADGAPVVALFRSRSDLEDFYETNKAPYSSGSALKTDAAFRDADDNYDDAFFAEHDIILVVNEESSGAYRDEIVRVTGSGGNIEVGLNRHVPGRGYGVTCDMAYWHIFVEVEKDIVPIRDITRIDVVVQTVEGPDAPGWEDEPGTTEPTTVPPATERPSVDPTKTDPTGVDPTKNEPTTAAPMTPVVFEAQYIRTNGCPRDPVAYPVVTAVKDRAELDAYYAKNSAVYDLGRHEKVYDDSTIGFLDACDRYDDAFFEKNDLILVLVDESSGSIRHQVESVRTDAYGGIEISIGRICPYVFTDDTAQWHIMIAVAKDPAHSGRDTAVALGDVVFLGPDGGFPEQPQIPGVKGVQYIRTARRAYDEIASPAVTLIKSRAELEEYCEKNKAEFSFDEADGSSIGFRDACAGYDDAFFEKNDLLLVMFEEGCDEIRHQVTGLTRTADGWQLSVEKTSPVAVSPVMAYWHIIVELEKGRIADAKDVSVKIENRAEHEFSASYVRTDWFGAELGLPELAVFGSREELDAYIDRVKELYAAEYPGQEWDPVGEFRTACEQYDDAFFAYRELVLLTVREPSGSISHEVTGVYGVENDGLRIAVKRIEPSPQTCDMAQWNILVALGKDFVPALSADKISVVTETVELTSEA